MARSCDVFLRLELRLCRRFLRRASLTPDRVPELLHMSGGAGEGGESAEAPKRAAAMTAHMQQLALQDRKMNGPAARSPGTPRMASLAPDLDFQEFLDRQKAFVEVRACILPS